MPGRDELENLLNKLDSEQGPLDEAEIFTAIRSLRTQEDTSDPSFEWLAEVTAFGLHENYSNQESGWGTYYGPMMTFTDGSEFPTMKHITEATITYWASRAASARHPVLSARYADLVWDFTEQVTGRAPEYTQGQIMIDRTIEMAEKLRHKRSVAVIDKLTRALNVALALNDKRRVASVAEATMQYERTVAIDASPGLWGFSFDLLLGNNKVTLTSEQEERIVSDLEDRLQRLKQSDGKSDVQPWLIESAAQRLARHYRRKNQNQKMIEAIKDIGEPFLAASAKASPLQASGWLKHVYTLYKEFGLNGEADSVAIKLREIGPKVSGELKPISAELKVSKEELKRYVENLTSGGLDDSLARIALHFIPRKSQTEAQLKELAAGSPISFFIPHQILDQKGRIAATVGPLKSDPDGHLIKLMAQDLSISSHFLRAVFDSVFRQYPIKATKLVKCLYRSQVLRAVLNWVLRQDSITATKLVKYLYQSPAFDEGRRAIIQAGIEEFLAEHHLSSTHILVPQIEEAVRTIVEKGGGSVLKAAQGGAMNLRTLDDLLQDPLIARIFGEDRVLYFRVLLTDSRGWNLRNNVCHGLLDHNMFGFQVSDRVIHMLLCLALVREEKKTS